MGAGTYQVEEEVVQREVAPERSAASRLNRPLRTAVARAAQEQIGLFFALDGVTVADSDDAWLSLVPRPPDPPLLFEPPIEGPPPEDLRFLP
jgi:hypothetical protein